jgi:hypothetical protein
MFAIRTPYPIRTEPAEQSVEEVGAGAWRPVGQLRLRCAVPVAVLLLSVLRLSVRRLPVGTLPVRVVALLLWVARLTVLRLSVLGLSVLGLSVLGPLPVRRLLTVLRAVLRGWCRCTHIYSIARGFRGG